jgi:peroxiredoxin
MTSRAAGAWPARTSCPNEGFQPSPGRANLADETSFFHPARVPFESVAGIMSEPTNIVALEARLDARRAQLDEAYLNSMKAAMDHLQRSGMASRAKAAGDRAPDFALATPDGATVMLSDLLSRGAVVLSFFRGEWCSFCRLEMDALIEACPRIVAEGAQLVMVSPQGPTDDLLERGAPVEGLTLLHDPMNGVGLHYGLVFRMPDILRSALLTLGVDLSHIYGTDAWFLPIPATYVIGQDGIVALAHADPDFTRRLEPDEIFAALQGLNRPHSARVA